MSTSPTGPTRDERPDPFGLKGTTVRDEFAIVACVAEGGFGVVYYAEQKPFGRPVAFKVLKPASTQSAEVRAQQAAAFIAECKITARLQVPNIAQALSAGTLTLPDGQPASWVALNWVPGQSLHRWLKERRRHVRAPLTPREALDLLRPVLVALARVHTEHKVAHRDLKPGNIMVTPRGDEYETHGLDFGIAKAMPSIELPATGMTMSESALQMFSPQYAAPEQIAATKTGPWSDVHALGLILTELLTGEASSTLGALGRVFVLRGTATGIDTASVAPIDPPTSMSDTFGRTLGGPGDLSGDGRADLVVPRPYASSNAGEVNVYVATASGLTSTRAQRLTAPGATEGRFGIAIAPR